MPPTKVAEAQDLAWAAAEARPSMSAGPGPGSAGPSNFSAGRGPSNFSTMGPSKGPSGIYNKAPTGMNSYKSNFDKDRDRDRFSDRDRDHDRFSDRDRD